MGGPTHVLNRLLRAAVALAVIGLVAACEAPTPTATAVNGAAPDAAAPDAAAPGPEAAPQSPAATPEAQRIVVEPGQSVSRLAAKYGVPRRAIIAANNLTPPYKIKIGQSLSIPGADRSPPAPAVAASSGPEIIPLDPPAQAGSAAAPSATALPAPAAAASPAPPPDVAAVKPLEAAASAGDQSPEPLSAPVTPVAATTSGPPVSSGPTPPPAPATTAAAAAPAPAAAPPPPGVTCPFGTTGMWSEDIIKKPVYICRKAS